MQALNLKPSDESDLLIFELGHKFTTAEIKKLRFRETEARNKTNRLLKSKSTAPESKYGIPFLGATVYRNHIIPGSRLVKNAKQALKEVVSGKRTMDSVPSYMGHFKYFNSYNILKEIFAETGWDYVPDDLLRTAFQKTRKSPLSDDFLYPYFN